MRVQKKFSWDFNWEIFAHFMKHWGEILNKCSLYLKLLIINQVSTKASTVEAQIFWKKTISEKSCGRNFSTNSSIKTTECQYKDKLLSIKGATESTIGNLRRPLLFRFPICKDTWLLQEPGLGPRAGLRADTHQVTAETRPGHQATLLFYPVARKRAAEGEDMQDGRTRFQAPGASSTLGAARRHSNQPSPKGITSWSHVSPVQGPIWPWSGLFLCFRQNKKST